MSSFFFTTESICIKLVSENKNDEIIYVIFISEKLIKIAFIFEFF